VALPTLPGMQGRKFTDKRKGHGFMDTMKNCLQPLFFKEKLKA